MRIFIPAVRLRTRCAATETQLFDNVKFLCECTSGYECSAGNGVGGLIDCNGSVCQNIDECTSGAAACDGNALCIDQTPAQNPAGYRCECKTGYFGNGLSCTQKTLCGQGYYVNNDPNSTTADYDCQPCAANTFQVSQTYTGTTCSPCPSGSESPSGASVCTDIVDCGPCTAVGNQSSCDDLTNDYHCNCKLNSAGTPGWSGENCQNDIDECAQTPNPCEASAKIVIT